MTTLPKVDQCVAMSTVLRPVTQIEDTAVKSASASGVAVREAVGDRQRQHRGHDEHEPGEDHDGESCR